MHAVVVRVKVLNAESAVQDLRGRVVPAVKQAPGFVAGYWTGSGAGDGIAMVVFESEDAARQAADQVPDSITKDVELQGVEVREVVASA